MRTFKFRNGDTMPILGLGTWKSSTGEVYDAVREAIRIGYRHIDCATRYFNEKEVGQALEDAMTSGDVTREELWITSKLWNNAHEKKYVEVELNNSLSNLRLDYLDLYLIHWPVATKRSVGYPEKGADFMSLEEIPLAETWSGMEEAAKKGLCRNIGVSNFSTRKLKDLSAVCEIKPEVNQIELHPFLQQNEMLDFCKKEGIHLTAYMPLGSKDRPDFIKTEREPVLLENSLIKKIAEDKGCSPAQVLIAWAIQRGTSVIPKSVNPERLKQNFDADTLVLSEEEMAQIATLDRHFRYGNGIIWTLDGSPYTLANLWDE